MNDPINHPNHYNNGITIECIDLTQNYSFTMGNVIKYLWRYQDKNNPIEDLEKPYGPPNSS